MFKYLTAKIANIQSKHTNEAILKRENNEFEIELNRVLGEIDKVTKDESKNSGEGFSYVWQPNKDLSIDVLERVHRELKKGGYKTEVANSYIYSNGYTMEYKHLKIYSNLGLFATTKSYSKVTIQWDHIEVHLGDLASLLVMPNYVAPESLDSIQSKIDHLVNIIAYLEQRHIRALEYNIHIFNDEYDELMPKYIKELSALKYPKGL